MYSKVTQKVRIHGKLGEAFQTFYGVKQGDSLSTDLFGIMIEILDASACLPWNWGQNWN